MTAQLAEKRRDHRVHTALPVLLDNATGVTGDMLPVLLDNATGVTGDMPPVFIKNPTGVTRDVSASGVFFWTSGTYAIGELISFSIDLKAESGEFMRKCQGAVIRTETLGHMVGVAARITESTMETA